MLIKSYVNQAEEKWVEDEGREKMFELVESFFNQILEAFSLQNFVNIL